MTTQIKEGALRGFKAKDLGQKEKKRLRERERRRQMKIRNQYVKTEDETPLPMDSDDSGKEKKLKAIHNASARELSKLKESISMISENNISATTFKEAIYSVMGSKSIRRLNDIKESIAKNYFCKSSFKNQD